MSKLLFAPTDTDTVALQRTRLAAAAVAGSNVSLTLESNSGFSDTDFLVTGTPGSEKAELDQINQAVSGASTVRVAALVRNHEAYEPVTKYRFNKRKFYGCATADGTYVELSGSPVTIGVDDQQGTYLEYTGSTYLYFKATYYNSTTLVETDIDEVPAMQADERLRYCSLWDIRTQAGLTDNPFVTDGYLERKRKQAENLIKSYIGGVYQLPLTEVPEMLQTIAMLLAGGYVNYEQYAQEGQGVKWLGEAKGILKAIQEGRQILFGSDDTEIPRLAGGGGLVIQGKPNTDGTADGSDDSPAKFTTGMTF